jgi:hypothetical protein
VTTIFHRLLPKNEPLFLSILLWVVAALRWKQKKAKKENDKIRAEEMKEKRFNELKDELREQTKTQKRLVRLFELRTLIKTAVMTKNKKLLKDANDEMAKFLGTSDSSPTDDADADADDDDADDDEFPPTIPRAGV